jgi:hypothetical protein
MNKIPKKPKPVEDFENGHVQLGRTSCTRAFETLQVDIGLDSWSDERGNLFAALAKAQGQIANAKKVAVNEYFKSKYATLTAVIEATKIPFAENEICVVQMLGHTTILESKTGVQRDYAIVQTLVAHSSGEFMMYETTCRVTDASPQKLGGGWTYLRRYTLCAIGQIGSEDYDGNDNIVEPESKPRVMLDHVTTVNQNIIDKFEELGVVRAEVEKMIGKLATEKWSTNDQHFLRKKWSDMQKESTLMRTLKKSGAVE